MVYDCEEIYGRCKCLKINTSNMLIKEILSETMSGGIAIVAQPMGKVIKRPNPSVFGTTKTKKKKLPEGEERSIIRDAAVDYLVDMFGGDNWELYADTKEEAEEKLYSELEILDIDEIIDPNMEVGGQRIGNFASGRVIDVVDSNEVIKAVSARLV